MKHRLPITVVCSLAAAVVAPAPSAAQRISAEGDIRAKPFAERFDPDAPTLVRGVLLSSNFDGPEAIFLVRDAAGTTFRVLGPAIATISRNEREAFEGKAGAQVAVRGYLAWDRACTIGCLIGARDITIATGIKLHTGDGAPRDAAAR